jgi:hypothetical protein
LGDEATMQNAEQVEAVAAAATHEARGLLRTLGLLAVPP